MPGGSFGFSMVRGMLFDMRLRGGAYDPDRTSPDSGAPVAGTPAAGGAAAAPEGTGVRQWRVSRRLLGLKAAGALGFALAALFSLGARDRFVVAGIAALLLAALAARDLLVPVRLAADATGITVVTGLAARHRVPWSVVRQLKVDQRQRFGLRSQLLEIDADETLFLLGEGDLGAPVVDVVEELRQLRVRATR